jgi:hypothetical protein
VALTIAFSLVMGVVALAGILVGALQLSGRPEQPAAMPEHRCWQ